MSEQLVPVLASVLQMEPTELIEKSKTPEGVEEITNKVKGFKVFNSNQDYLNALNTHVKNVTPTITDEFYRTKKKDLHASFEKEIKGDDPDLQALEFGKDYQSTAELVQKKIDLLAKKSGTGKKEEWQTEKEQMLQKLQELTTKATNAETEAVKKYKAKADALEIGYAIEAYKPRVNTEADKVGAQLKLLKALHEESGVTLDADDAGKRILRDKDGNILKNEDFTPMTLEQHLEGLAVKNLPLHKVTPAGGRGDNSQNNGNNGGDDMSLYQTWEDFLKTARGKTLVTGSKEANDLYGKWIKAHPNKQ